MVIFVSDKHVKGHPPEEFVVILLDMTDEFTHPGCDFRVRTAFKFVNIEVAQGKGAHEGQAAAVVPIKFFDQKDSAVGDRLKAENRNPIPALAAMVMVPNSGDAYLFTNRSVM
jgi:hypothetical protein